MTEITNTNSYTIIKKKQHGYLDVGRINNQANKLNNMTHMKMFAQIMKHLVFVARIMSSISTLILLQLNKFEIQ